MDMSFLDLFFGVLLLVKSGSSWNLTFTQKSQLTSSQHINSSWSYSSMFSPIKDGFFLVLFFPVLSYQRWILLGLILSCSLLSKMDSSWSYSSLYSLLSKIDSFWSYSSMFSLIMDVFLLVLFFPVLSF